MDKAAREALAAKILDISKAAATEVIVFDQDERLTRFTHNAIHQNVAASEVSVRVRAIVDDRCGVAGTNDLSEGSLANAVARACEIARISPPDPDLPPLRAYPPAATPEGAYDDAAADASARERALIARALFDAAERDGLWASGFVSTARAGITIANTSGGSQSFDGSDCGLNVKQNGPTSSGYAERFSVRLRDIDGAAAGAIAARKAVESADPVAVEPGEWTVIMEPAAFGELVAFLAEHFSAQSYDEGSSFFSGRIGERFAGENVTLLDDIRHPLNPGVPFDFEGAPTQAVVLLDRGVAQDLVTDSRWARKLGRGNNGHGLPEPNAFGPFARHLVVQPGTASHDELIAGTKRGLLVSRLWYTRTVDQRQTIVTGMTRDGTFLIQDGKVVGGVRNLRFNQSIIEALSACTLSSELARTAGYSHSLVIPSVKFDRFTFSSATDF